MTFARLLSDGETLVVANGGLATHPDLNRAKRNLPTMAPSLCTIDRRDGALLQELRLDPALHQLSIRHLAVGPADTVALAMQYEGAAALGKQFKGGEQMERAGVELRTLTPLAEARFASARSIR